MMRTYIKYLRACVIALVAFLGLTLTACKTTTRVVTEYRDRKVHDTIQQVDSIFQDRVRKIFTNGDTTYIHDSVYLYKYKYLDKNVEVYIRDSIPYEVEVQVPVEEHGFLWKSGVALWVIVALILVGILIGIVLKFAK